MLANVNWREHKEDSPGCFLVWRTSITVWGEFGQAGPVFQEQRRFRGIIVFDIMWHRQGRQSDTFLYGSGIKIKK